MPSIKITAIGMPEHYVRGTLVDGRTVGGINGKNLNDLLDVVLKANGEIVPKKLRGKKIVWPFHTSIILAKNTEPLKGKKLKGVKAEGKGKKKGKVWRPYELIDGGHRLTLWRRLGQKEIEATVKTITDPSERYKEQFDTNSSHGFRLDKDHRDNYVRTQHNVFKRSLVALAKETGLNRSSIIRIMAEKQRKKEPRKKGAFTKTTTHEAELSIEGFYSRLMTLVSNYDRIQKELESFLLANVTKAGRSKLGSIVAIIKRMAASFEVPLNETTERKAEQANASA